MDRFLILGLPRSGSTYLMTLLNAHGEVFCSGEQYNPYAVVGIAERDDNHETVLGRDKAPLDFMESFFENAAEKGVAWAGFKYMIGHNVEVLNALAEDPDLAFIYVWRENRLAQASSLIKAVQSQNWAQTEADDHVARKVHATPRQISQRWHEYATYDALFGQWLAGRPNRKITLEYRELFAPGFEERICGFLGLRADPRMKSPLVKQSPNKILDRFAKPGPIQYYFRQIGYGRWLDEEL